MDSSRTLQLEISALALPGGCKTCSALVAVTAGGDPRRAGCRRNATQRLRAIALGRPLRGRRTGRGAGFRNRWVQQRGMGQTYQANCDFQVDAPSISVRRWRGMLEHQDIAKSSKSKQYKAKQRNSSKALRSKANQSNAQPKNQRSAMKLKAKQFKAIQSDAMQS